MKKLLLSLIAIVGFAFTSNAQKTEGFIKPEMYGVYHNEILKIYMDKYKTEHSLNFRKISNLILEDFEAIHPGVLSNEEKEFYQNRINESFEDKELVDFNYNDFVKKSIQKYYSKNLQLLFIDIVDNPNNLEIILQKISTFEKNNNLSELDLSELEKFKGVLKASYEFWKVSSFSNVNSKMKCNPRHQVYIGDACGSVFGGWGSGVFSAFIEEAQSQHGGGCI